MMKQRLVIFHHAVKPLVLKCILKLSLLCSFIFQIALHTNVGIALLTG